MGKLTANIIFDKIVNHLGKFDLNDIEQLSSDEKYSLATDLVDYTEKNTDTLDRIARIVGYMVPYISSDKRFSLLSRLINLLHESEKDFGQDIYNALDFSVARLVHTLELISLANLLSEFMHSKNNKWRQASMWGLIRVIPHLHSVNQKEYATDIYMLGQYKEMREKVVDGLTSLIFSLEQDQRTELTIFFADMLRQQDVLGSRFFAIDLLARVTPALAEEDRIMVADHVSPLIYFTDVDIVKKSVSFFASIISLLPVGERFHYTQMIAGLINDKEVHSEIVSAIERSLPFLLDSREKLQFVELLMQYKTKKTFRSKEEGEDLSLSLDYYHDKLT